KKQIPNSKEITIMLFWNLAFVIWNFIYLFLDMFPPKPLFRLCNISKGRAFFRLYKNHQLQDFHKRRNVAPCLEVCRLYKATFSTAHLPGNSNCFHLL